jgi:hypothetical protein
MFYIFIQSSKNDLNVFENRVLARIFGLKRDDVTGEWGKLQSGELHNLYSSPDIIRQIKSRRMRWVGHVARTGERRKVYKVLVGKPKGRKHLEDRVVDGRMELGWILRRVAGVGGMCSGFTWFRTGTGVGLL